MMYPKFLYFLIILINILFSSLRIDAVISEAKEEQISTQCYSKNAPSAQEMKEYLVSRKKHTDSILTFPNFELRDDTYLIELFKSIIAVNPYASYSYGYNSSKKIRDRHKKWKDDFVDYGCSNVFCYAEKLFGKDLALRILYMKARFGFNSSPYNFLGTKIPTIKEFDFILSVLSDLPKNMNLSKNIRNDHRLTLQSENTKSDKVWADNAIRLYPSFFTKSLDRQRRTLVHEIGHNIQRMDSNLHNDLHWLKIGGWIKKEKNYGSGIIKEIWKTRGFDQSPIDYGRIDPFEDFAVTFSQYRYRADWLKKVSPKRYEYMKKYVYQNIEYLNSTCPFDQN